MADRPWRDDDQLPAPLREIIASAHEDEPHPKAVRSLAARLGPMVGMAVAADAVTATAAKGALALKVKVLAVVLLVVPGVYVGQRWLRAPAQPRGPVAAPVATPAPATAPAPVQPPAAPEPAAPSAPPASRPGATRPSATVVKGARPVADTVAQEAALLESARRDLGQRPADALSAADVHQSRFPRGVLAQERELLAIDALWRLGQYPAAHQRGRHFLDKYPTSAHGPAVRAILARARR